MARRSISRIEFTTGRRTPARTARLVAVAIACALAFGAVATSVNARGRHAPTPSSRSTGTARTLAAVAAVAVFSPPANPSQRTPGLSVTSGQNQSDPFLYLSGDRYFLYTSGYTTGWLGAPPTNVPVASATNFGNWGPVTDALPTLPPWAVSGFTWAPDVHRFGPAYVLYFTAVLRGSSPPMQCIGDATGTSPDGPFTPISTPIICQADQGGSIDPRVFTDRNGANWMLWKSDQNIAGSNTPTKMWSQPLAPDGLSLVGAPNEIMQPDEAWQGTIVEAPDMVEVNGTYWVVYSGNWFNQPAYGIGAARCAGPAGPCSDTSTLPLLGTNAQGEGPGEASVFKDSSGVWMLYSPWRSLAPKPDVPPRPVYVTRLGFGPWGPYLAAGGPPPSLDALTGAPLWPSGP